MNITPITNYFQIKKNNQQKYVTNNINFGMAKLDQVQLSKSKDEYYQRAREDYARHFWTFHPEDEQYVPKLGSAEADKEYFIKNWSKQDMLDTLDTNKFGADKNQNFYQVANLDGYYNLPPENRRLILNEIVFLPVLKDGEQRKTVLSELAQADIEEFRSFLGHNLWRYKNPETREAILTADTYLWDTLDDKNKRFILDFMSRETELKLVAQEMEKLPDFTSDESQSSILTAYADADNLGRREFLKLIDNVDDETLLSWMKKDNVFVRRIGVSDVMELAKRVGVDEFDNLYGKKYGKLFDSFFNSYGELKFAIESYGVNKYKEQYEQQFGDWEQIKYLAFLHDSEYYSGLKLDVLEALKSNKFKNLDIKYQTDFINKVLNGEIKYFSSGSYFPFGSAELQRIVEDYAINNENVSIEDSIKILEGLSKVYADMMAQFKSSNQQVSANHYQD